MCLYKEGAPDRANSDTDVWESTAMLDGVFTAHCKQWQLCPLR